MKRRAFLAMLMALAVPGAGHFYLGRRGRAMAFFVIVVSLFLIGLSIDGGLYTVATSRGAVLRLLATISSMGTGLLYLIAKTIGAPGVVISATYEYGSMFTHTAGLMNLLLVLDCYDIAMGRKP